MITDILDFLDSGGHKLVKLSHTLQLTSCRKLLYRNICNIFQEAFSDFFRQSVYRSTGNILTCLTSTGHTVLTSILNLKIIYFKFTTKTNKFLFDGKSVQLIFTSRYILSSKVTEQCIVISQTKIKYDAKQQKDYDHRGKASSFCRYH
jgi:hypothetical protein